MTTVSNDQLFKKQGEQQMLTIVASILTFRMITERGVINLVFAYPVIAMICDVMLTLEILKSFN